MHRLLRTCWLNLRALIFLQKPAPQMQSGERVKYNHPPRFLSELFTQEDDGSVSSRTEFIQELVPLSALSVSVPQLLFMSE